MLQPPVTEVSCGLRCVRAARCVAASESKKNAACLHRCISSKDTEDSRPKSTTPTVSSPVGPHESSGAARAHEWRTSSDLS